MGVTEGAGGAGAGGAGAGGGGASYVAALYRLRVVHSYGWAYGVSAWERSCAWPHGACVRVCMATWGMCQCVHGHMGGGVSVWGGTCVFVRGVPSHLCFRAHCGLLSHLLLLPRTPLSPAATATDSPLTCSYCHGLPSHLLLLPRTPLSPDAACVCCCYGCDCRWA